MELLVNSDGAFLGKSGNRFVILESGNKKEFCADDVTQILLGTRCSISSSATQLAIEKDIDLVYLDWRGIPYARTYPCKLGGTTLTRKKQAEACVTEVGGEIAKAIERSKILNQAAIIAHLSKSRREPELQAKVLSLKEYASRIEELRGTPDEIRQQILGLEGIAAKTYWETLSMFLPFDGRKPESSDSVNVLLNYGYGILYAQAERACVLAGLDPFLGFLHTDRYGKPSMALDLMETFRPLCVDKPVLTLYGLKQISDKWFEERVGTLRLSKEGRTKAASAFLERLAQTGWHQEKRTPLKDLILVQARSITKKLLLHSEKLEMYVARSTCFTG